MRDVNKFNAYQKALMLYTEKQLRCGDGAGNPITSHSVQCRCEEINKELDKLEKIFMGNKPD